MIEVSNDMCRVAIKTLRTFEAQQLPTDRPWRTPAAMQGT